MNSTSGFTLIELILVTVIIGILAGMITANYSGRVQEAQIRAAKGDIATLSTQVDLYTLDNNDQYPNSLDDLVTGKRRYVRELRPDPWAINIPINRPRISCLPTMKSFPPGRTVSRATRMMLPLRPPCRKPAQSPFSLRKRPKVLP